MRLHDLRHFHASMLLRANTHPKVVRERLGHATISVTLDTYSHCVPALQPEAANDFARPTPIGRERVGALGVGRGWVLSE